MKQKQALIFIVTILLAAGTVSCPSSRWDPWGEDSLVRASWTINNAAADESVCAEAGASFVRMSINKSPEPWYDSRLQWECRRSWTLTDEFSKGEYYIQWELLDADEQIIVSTPRGREMLEQGENNFIVKFYTD